MAGLGTDRCVAAGCLVTRRAESEVLLVHPRGASFCEPLFGIPKGAVDDGESLEAAALRETLEETGLRVCLRVPLGSVVQRGGRKLVRAFWATLDSDAEPAIDERGVCRGGDDENDVCGFFAMDRAYEMMVPAQRVFLDRLRQHRAADR